MSHDILLRHHSPLPAATAHVPDDLFATPINGGGGGNGNGGHQQTPAQKVHRLLRGRYVLAITLALLGGAIGAAIGYYTQAPTYRSNGVLQINPIVHNVLTNEKSVPFFRDFIQSQPNIIMSSRVVQKAAETEEWKKTNLSYDEGTDLLPDGLSATWLRNSPQHIQITFEALDPYIAQQGVRAVISAYQQLFNETNGQKLKGDLETLQKEIDDTSLKIKRLEDQILLIAKSHGTTDLSVLHDEMQRQLLEYKRELRDANFQLSQAEAALSEDKPQDLPELSPQQIAQVDDTMRNYITQREQLLMQLEESKLTLGEKHRETVRVQGRIDLMNRYIESYANTWRQEFIPPVTDGVNQFIPTPMTVHQLRERMRVLQARLDEHVTETDQIGRQRYEVGQLQTEIGRSRTDLERFNKLYEDKLYQASSDGILSVVEFGSRGALRTDGRMKMAAIGFMGGSALPIALLLLLGVLNDRYRYSEETKTDMSGMRLLGILPNLPDRLSDPEQAQTAAYCVHQIRTMLQIGNARDQQVYAITSGAPGDGKTSLSLALGLSFAASGSRTLLIDCDLVGAGLTARLDMTGPEGVLEAMTNRSLMDYVRSTDIADLSILPVGLAQAHHAGLFSPAALSRLIAEAKKHFEVVLIDTGPILGSIEATPVAAAADGVILCVKRGEPRQIVEKAMTHLQQIGARFAGVVFNKAEAGDFASSISGMSLRSIARQQRHTGGGGAGGANGHGRETASKAFGPVARAVATSFRAEDESKSSS